MATSKQFSVPLVTQARFVALVTNGNQAGVDRMISDAGWSRPSPSRNWRPVMHSLFCTSCFSPCSLSVSRLTKAVLFGVIIPLFRIGGLLITAWNICVIPPPTFLKLATLPVYEDTKLRIMDLRVVLHPPTYSEGDMLQSLISRLLLFTLLSVLDIVIRLSRAMMTFACFLMGVAACIVFTRAWHTHRLTLGHWVGLCAANTPPWMVQLEDIVAFVFRVEPQGRGRE